VFTSCVSRLEKKKRGPSNLEKNHVDQPQRRRSDDKLGRGARSQAARVERTKEEGLLGPGTVGRDRRPVVYEKKVESARLFRNSDRVEPHARPPTREKRALQLNISTSGKREDLAMAGMGRRFSDRISAPEETSDPNRKNGRRPFSRCLREALAQDAQHRHRRAWGREEETRMNSVKRTCI